MGKFSSFHITVQNFFRAVEQPWNQNQWLLFYIRYEIWCETLSKFNSVFPYKFNSIFPSAAARRSHKIKKHVYAIWAGNCCCWTGPVVFRVYVGLFWNKYLTMDANVDQHIRDIQRQYLDFLDDDVRIIIFLEISS